MYSKLEIAQLEEKIANDLNRLLSHFTDIQILGQTLSCKCMIHDGDNEHSMWISKEKKQWRCWTAECSQVFKGTLIGLVRALLSKKYCSWQVEGDEIYPFYKTLEFIEDIYGKNKELTIDEICNIYEKKCNYKTRRKKNYLCTRDYFVKRNGIISEYMLGRGFSREVLNKFDVYSCKEDSIFKDRTLVPLLDETAKYVLGITARTENGSAPKWKHTYEFPSSTKLYNVWNASKYTPINKQLYIVESPGNVWRLEEAGVFNGVALFGGFLTPAKAYIIDQLGVGRLNLLLDNDDAGKEFANRIAKEYGQFYNIKIIKLPNGVNDIASMPVNDVKHFLKVSK